MTDDDRPGTARPTRQERLEEQLRANLKRRKEQARARRGTRTDEAIADKTMPSSEGDGSD